MTGGAISWASTSSNSPSTTISIGWALKIAWGGSGGGSNSKGAGTENAATGGCKTVTDGAGFEGAGSICSGGGGRCSDAVGVTAGRGDLGGTEPSPRRRPDAGREEAGAFVETEVRPRARTGVEETVVGAMAKRNRHSRRSFLKA